MTLSWVLALLASSPLYRDLVGQFRADHDPAAEREPGSELASRVWPTQIIGRPRADGARLTG